ncbi:MAG TPA: matrixin family metalloprotease [Planctomycetaceae bacterium]|nr:matrixin family metalloprotease [Planctomycetaceae bacterium]
MKLHLDERGRCVPWAASILTGLAIFALGDEPPRHPVAIEDPVASAPALSARTLERAPLVRIRQEGFGCLQHTDPSVPCAMYAPGYKPQVNNEDTPHPVQAGEFNVQNPAWKWPQPGGAGATVDISYSYSNLLNGSMSGVTANQLRAGVQEALSVWASVAPLNFTEVADSGPLPTPADTSYAAGTTPNLRFGLHAFDGPFGVLAHAYFPSSLTSGLAGDLHFDSGEPWAISPASGKIDFIEVCVHEVGHALGLGHQNPPVDAIMNPFYGARYFGPGSAFLLADDQSGIKSIYGSSCAIRSVADKAKLLPYAAGIKLGAVAAPERLYTDLRQYRDRVLQGSPTGRQLVAAYYQHGPEVIQVLSKRPDLTVQAIQLLAAVQGPVSQRDGKTDIVRLPKVTFDRGVDFLVALEDLVSGEARLVIEKTREVLNRMQTTDGNTVLLDFRAVQ